MCRNEAPPDVRSAFEVADLLVKCATDVQMYIDASADNDAVSAEGVFSYLSN